MVCTTPFLFSLCKRASPDSIPKWDGIGDSPTEPKTSCNVKHESNLRLIIIIEWHVYVVWIHHLLTLVLMYIWGCVYKSSWQNPKLRIMILWLLYLELCLNFISFQWLDDVLVISNPQFGTTIIMGLNWMIWYILECIQKREGWIS